MKIGVILFGLLGDVLMRTSALRELRQIFPDATIHCYVDPIGAEVLSLSLDARRVVRVVNRSKKSQVLYLWRKVLLHWSVRCESFDILIDLYNGPASHWLLFTSRSKSIFKVKDSLVVSIPKARGRIARTHPNRYHLSNLYFALVDNLNSPIFINPDVRPWVDLTPLSNQCRKFDSRYYFISLAAGDARKNLPVELLCGVAGWLYREHGLVPIVARNPGQEMLQEEFVNHPSVASIPPVRLGHESLSELLVIMQSVRLSILPDTGLFHLALASGAPVFGVFTHTHPLLVDPQLSQVSTLFERHESAHPDKHGLPLGTKEISTTSAIAALDTFIKRIENTST